MIAFFSIAAVMMMIWVISLINATQDRKDNRDVENFANSLNNALKMQVASTYDSKEKFVFFMPPKIDKICLVDKKQKIDPLISIELTKEIDIYKNKNLFLSPFKERMPFELEYLRLNDSENPLCIENTNGKISLDLISKGDSTLVTSTDPLKKVECVSVLYNGDENSHIDIVFLAEGYEKKSQFDKDIDNYINNLFFKVEPFINQKKIFNFHKVDEFRDLGCKIDDFILCSEYKIKAIASNCPNDYIVVLVDRSKIMDFLLPIRSSAISNIAKINTADDNLVLLHEFGHIFGKLADEYVDDSYYRNFDVDAYQNCDKTPCDNWNNVDETGCFKGCSVSMFYRSTEGSIMRNYFKSEDFGPVNTDILNQHIEAYK